MCTRRLQLHPTNAVVARPVLLQHLPLCVPCRACWLVISGPSPPANPSSLGSPPLASLLAGVVSGQQRQLPAPHDGAQCYWGPGGVCQQGCRAQQHAASCGGLLQGACRLCFDAMGEGPTSGFRAVRMCEVVCLGVISFACPWLCERLLLFVMGRREN